MVESYGGDVGDLNNDGIDDIVAVAKPDASWNQDDGIVILLSQSDGTFSDVTSTIVDERYTIERNGESIEVLQYGSRSLTIGDFDGDGWNDIYLENQSSKTTALLFNNEGIGVRANTPDKISYEDWKKVIDINLNGSFICAKIAFKIMKNQIPQGGRIINNGSVSAHVPRPGSSPYTASKHAITGLTKSISLDGRPFNIACSQIDIGNALTEMVKKMKSGINQADGSVKSEATMDPIHIANNVYNIAELPLDANIQFMTVMATNMPYIGRG